LEGPKLGNLCFITKSLQRFGKQLMKTKADPK